MRGSGVVRSGAEAQFRRSREFLAAGQRTWAAVESYLSCIYLQCGEL